MEPEEEEEILPMQPFWLQNADHLHRRRLRRSYSLLLTSASLLVLLLVTALTLAFIVVPTLHSFASHIFKPHTIKNSWDSLNLIFVIFAIACAFLTKNTTTTTTTEPETPLQRSFSNLRQQDHYVKQNSILSRTWCEYEYPRRTDYNKSLSRLRSFNSYPDLRQESSWITTEERWRFYDDTHLDSRRQPRREEEEAKEETVIETVATATREEEEAKEETVIETVAMATSKEVASRSPRRSKAVRRNAKRTQQVEIIEKPSTPPPPPPPETAEIKTLQGKKRRKSATKEFLTSLTGKKKKKQRRPSVENFETILILNSEPFPIASQPLPEPHSVFQNLFSSKKSQHKTKRHPDPVAIHKPASSNKRERFYSLEEKYDVVITGNESPLIPIPPPPPPPFKLPAWKFRVQGDFVRVDSIGSSGSSAVEEAVESPVGQEGSQCNSPCDPHGGGESVGSLFCPSPDVDTKAYSFIERFRAGLRMEKMNSMKEKQGIGRSSLGSSSTSPITKQETTPT